MDLTSLMVRAYEETAKSDFTDNPNGAILVFVGKELHSSTDNMVYMSPAIENLIVSAASVGIKTSNLTIFTPWLADLRATRLIILAKIGQIILHRRRMQLLRWQQLIEVKGCLDWLNEAGIEVKFLNHDLPQASPVKVDGRSWQP